MSSGSLLLDAVEHGNLAEVQRLIHEGADVNDADSGKI